MAHIDRVLGVCLVHCTGTTAGFMESLKDKVTLITPHHNDTPRHITPQSSCFHVTHSYKLPWTERCVVTTASAWGTPVQSVDSCIAHNLNQIWHNIIILTMPYPF